MCVYIYIYVRVCNSGVTPTSEKMVLFPGGPSSKLGFVESQVDIVEINLLIDLLSKSMFSLKELGSPIFIANLLTCLRSFTDITGQRQAQVFPSEPLWSCQWEDPKGSAPAQVA